MMLLELGTLFLLCSDEVFQILMVVYGWDDILPGRVLSRCVHDQNRSEAEEESKIFLISALWVPENLVDKDSFEKVESSMILLTKFIHPVVQFDVSKVDSVSRELVVEPENINRGIAIE